MVLAKSKNSVGLGNCLMNDRFGKGRGSDRKKFTVTGIHRTDHATGETYITNERQEPSWVKMRSITEQATLDEFLATAQLAGTDFTAEKVNQIKIIHTNLKNPYLLSSVEERAVVEKQTVFKDRLTVPRRPNWDSQTTPQELDRLEKESLLEWRRGLAELQQNHDLLMTPFERNLEVWRQLWRVVERSDLIIQIVDARNPLLFRSEDLEKFVKETDPRKNNLLLINKADMLTLRQRRVWADYFEEVNIPFRFFSASMAKEMNESREYIHESRYSTDKSVDYARLSKTNKVERKTLGLETEGNEELTKKKSSCFEQGGTRILTVDELEALFLQHISENLISESNKSSKIQIGLVGYPNVGKSSTINAMIGAKKVSVSSTPGKTKHFQTIHLSDKILLCDCPGLVFPNFATTKAELVCNGILPIDQLREFSGPVSLITSRIPQKFLEALYSIKIITRPPEEDGTGIPTAEELLIAYAKSRGFTRSGQGQPDESRAARYILKDYVNGKLLYCLPPPLDIDPLKFNSEHYDKMKLCEKKNLVTSTTGSSIVEQQSSEETKPILCEQGFKSKKLDRSFFTSDQGNEAHLRMPFNYKYSQQSSMEQRALLGNRNNKSLILENEIGLHNNSMLISKKHFKNGKKSGGKRRPNYFED